MTATCSSCNQPFTFNEERFGERASVNVRCPSCKAVVTLTRPAAVPAEAPSATPSPASADASGPRLEIGVEDPAKDAPGPPTVKVKRKKILDGQIEEEHIPPLPEDRRISLAILSGPNSGQVIPCATSRAVIGRAGSDIPIDDEEISRTHALIEIRDDRYFLKDLGSTNGTFVDERRITKMEIFNKGEFRVGTTHCMLIVTPKEDL
jgi:hypothetical protein